MELLCNASSTILNGILPSALNTVFHYFKNKEKDTCHVRAKNKLEEKIKVIEEQLLSSIEETMIRKNFVFNEIIKGYDLKELYRLSNYIFTNNNLSIRVKNSIEEIINNYHIKKFGHFNILLVGNNYNNNSLIKSISDLYNIKEEEIPIKSEKYKNNGIYASYIGKEIRILNYKEKDLEKIKVDNENELKKDNQNTYVDNMKQFIDEELMNNNQDMHIHCIWYYLKEDEINDNEIKNIKELIKYFKDILPIIILFKQTFYSSDDSIDPSEEIKNEIKEEITVFKLSSKKDIENYIKSSNVEIFDIKSEIDNLINISKDKNQLYLNSSNYFSYILKNIYKYENNKKYEKIKTKIREKTNCFLPGNTIQNLNILNKQIINNSLTQLLNIKSLDSFSKEKINELLKNFEKFISEKCNNHFINEFGNCNYDDLFQYIENLEENKNENDIDIEKKILTFTKKSNDNEKKNKMVKEEELKNKIKNIYILNIIKDSSYFIDCKLIEELIKLLNESFNNQINDFSELIKNKIKNNEL